MISVEQIIKDAIEAGVRASVSDKRAILRSACLVQPNYENPFGFVDGVEEHIDGILELIRPSIICIETDKVYRRMSNLLREQM